MTAPTHATLPVSICCASWRTKPQHDDCPGRLKPGNRVDAPMLPCGCTECAGKPNHRVYRESM